MAQPDSTTDPQPAVRIDNLVVRRGSARALNGVTLSVPRGSITGLLGPSGCGKTTLMRSVVGTQRITSGSITVLDRPAGSKELRGRVGYVTQAPSVYTDLTVEENVRYFADLYRRRDLINDSIHAVGLDDFRVRRTSQLSGGQRSRVSIACALVGSPEILILDEPTVGLDPVLRAELWVRFRALADTGTTLLVSSHVMDEADHCDALVLMREGGVIAELTPDELRARTHQTNLEQAFLALITERTAS
ncbi:ABC transporter ATP-binding protein [Williamsia muralis]|jgi:ABC-2 type transport system ATP-binding protein|uniref:ABC transporter ATP-binding protein n=1 Tax=Williamsia marianensis TaxID=85044 RepID=A0ABU4EZK5_WILMA|nr:ABC transporter ATP-binding protein [Williamsia muralis]MDV7136687.1 ABC transporter ATP-binding protein [Williamsia muralis]